MPAAALATSEQFHTRHWRRHQFGVGLIGPRCAHPASMLRRVLATFGNGDCGRLGFARVGVSEQLPRVVKALLDVQIKQAACGGAHTVVLADDGTVFTMGLNDHGQLGHSAGQLQVPVRSRWLRRQRPHTAAAAARSRHQPPPAHQPAPPTQPTGRCRPRYPAQVPQEVLVPEPVVAVAAGNTHTLALADSGNVWAWGLNDKGQLGIGPDLGSTPEPRLVKALQGAAADSRWCL